MEKKQKITIEQMEKLPDFLRIELIDGEICTDDWTELEIDESVFQNPPSASHHVKYRLTVVGEEER